MWTMITVSGKYGGAQTPAFASASELETQSLPDGGEQVTVRPTTVSVTWNRLGVWFTLALWHAAHDSAMETG